MRNGIIAASIERRAEAERAAEWMARLGGRVVPITDSNDACWVAVVTDGGPAVDVLRGTGPRGVSIGPGRTTPQQMLEGRQAPLHTVAAAVDESGKRCVVGAGVGNLRLFVHDDAQGKLVSTSVGALVTGLGDRAELDRSYEDFQLGFGFLPDERTLFRGVSSLPRPCLNSVVGDTPQPTGPRPTSEGDSEVVVPDDAEGIADLLLEILDEVTAGIDHVGVLLGGFDSALVAAGLHHIGKQVSTFTFEFGDECYNQRHVAEVVAASAADHHPVPITADVIGRSLAHLPEMVNQPGAQPHYQVQTIVAAAAARDAGVERLLSGDGCDALFLAYPTVNTRAAAAQAAAKLPQWVSRAGLALLSSHIMDHRLGHVARVARSTLRAALLHPPANQHLPTQYMDNITLERLDRGSRPSQAETISAIRARLADEVRHLDDVQRAFDGNSLAGHSQSKVEGAVLRSGLTIRSPYTHPKFRSAIARLPRHLTRPEGRLARAEGKPILQRAALEAGLLPRVVVEQPKQAPTLAPLDEWFAGPLRGQVMDMLADLPFDVDLDVVSEILRPKRAEDLYRRKVALSRHIFQAIGLLASYSAFARLAPR